LLSFEIFIDYIHDIFFAKIFSGGKSIYVYRRPWPHIM